MIANWIRHRQQKRREEKKISIFDAFFFTSFSFSFALGQFRWCACNVCTFGTIYFYGSVWAEINLKRWFLSFWWNFYLRNHYNLNQFSFSCRWKYWFFFLLPFLVQFQVHRRVFFVSFLLVPQSANTKPGPKKIHSKIGETMRKQAERKKRWPHAYWISFLLMIICKPNIFIICVWVLKEIFNIQNDPPQIIFGTYVQQTISTNHIA